MALSSVLQPILDKACADPVNGVPGAVVVIVDKSGKELFAGVAGQRGVASSEPAKVDDIFCIASCTKLVTVLAALQLVEQKKLSLDDGDQLEGLLPEFKDIQVLVAKDAPGANTKTRVSGHLALEPKNKKITLRMLLSQTAGFGYTMYHEKLRDWFYPVGLDETACSVQAITQPLLFQPGEKWVYGVGIDWAGVAIERLTKKSLGEYFEENIFKPLGLSKIGFFPTAEMKDRLMYMHTRKADGTAIPRDHFIRAPLLASTPEERKDMLQSGAGGLFGSPQDFARIVGVVLNGGTCPRTGAQILNTESFAELIKNQIPDMPDFARTPFHDCKPELVRPQPEMLPVPGNPPQGWCFAGFQPNADFVGQSKTTIQWTGLANTWWWCDREKGVAGFVCAQILPFPDEPCVNLLMQTMGALYQNLGKA